MQACPTGALAEKGWAVEEMVKRNDNISPPGDAPGRRSNEARSSSPPSGWTAAPAATCRCSTWTRASRPCAQKADIVYGPLVDAQEFPEGVDVTLVEGAVSSQDDLKQDPD